MDMQELYFKFEDHLNILFPNMELGPYNMVRNSSNNGWNATIIHAEAGTRTIIPVGKATLYDDGKFEYQKI